ncbi:hypothetical protein ASE01_22760 [Nocardioides sp. Root190]|uniref:hypothetical protein n=1 Tax=Nocardioides sp. Root190 TaxID=1736488 RepID=UPI0006FF1D20|nr:hypothetical protein [Nocardioides sp. Root190]KRB79559.1 hypothetical protein ASE01_22760 [Nocardioides sp. Root190]
MRNEGVEKSELFRSGGIVVGAIGLVAAAVVLVYSTAVVGFDPLTWSATLLLAVIVWSVLIRPAVVLHVEELEVRNVSHTLRIPYQRIREVEINQVTRVHTPERTYVAGGFGRSRGTIRKDARVAPDAKLGQHSLGHLVEERINRRATEAKRTAVEGAEVAPVRRTWAAAELGAGAVLVVATLLASVLR